MSEESLPLEEAYAKACQCLGEVTVLNRFLLEREQRRRQAEAAQAERAEPAEPEVTPTGG